MSDPYPITAIPAEALLYAGSWGLVQAAIAVVVLVLATPMLRRNSKRYVGLARAFITFNICFLLTSALANGLWSYSIWGRIYFSTDYVVDFNPFYPISQAWIEIPFGNTEGKIFPGFTIIHVRVAWFLFAFASWASAIFLYSRTQRLWTRKRADSEQVESTGPVKAAPSAPSSVR